MDVSAQASEEDLLKALKTTPVEDHDSIYYELFKVNMYDDLQKAKRYASWSYKRAELSNHYLYKIKASRALSFAYKKLLNQDSTLYYFYNGIKLCKRLDADKYLLMALYTDLGTFYDERDKYDSAFKYYRIGKDIANLVNDPEGRAALDNNLGLLYYYLNDYATALKYLKSSLDIKIDNNLNEKIPRGHLNIVAVYNDMNDFNQALFHLTKVQDLCNNGCKDEIMADYYYGLGEYLFNRGKLQESRTAFDKSLTIATKIGKRDTEAYALFRLSKFYNTGSIKLDLIGRAESIARKIKLRRLSNEIYLEYIQFYNLERNSSKEQFYRNKYLITKDSLINEHVLIGIVESELESQQRQSNQIIQQKEAQLSQFQLIIIFVTIITLLLGIVSVLLYKRYILNKRLKQILEKQVRLRTSDLVHNNSELNQLNAEYEMLLQQTSKYVKGPLATLMGLIELAEKDRDPERTQEYIVKIKKIASSMGLSLEQLKAIAELRVSDQEYRRDLLKQNLITQDQHN